ncbi:MAG: hypothetical protein JW700_03275 [Candidatus Aenigmarchaeota archaeon]|nr:hypothetical protein [Candidatus Aenigmarchaeota archaeon]
MLLNVYNFSKERKEVDTIKLPVQNIIVFNEDLFTPILLPKNERNPDSVGYYDRELKLGGDASKKILLVDALEKGKLKNNNIYPAITNASLEDLGRMDNLKIIKEWKKSVNDKVYFIEIEEKDFRSKKYEILRDKFLHKPDLFTLLTSYQLGADIVSDKRELRAPELEEYTKAFFERWGMKKKFRKHTSESIIRNAR